MIGKMVMISVCLLCTAMGGIQTTPQTEDTKAYQAAYAHVLDEQWDEVIAKMGSVLERFPKSSWVDDASFWRCYALQEKDQTEEESFECFKKFLEKWPGSQWADDARELLTVLASDLAERGKPEYRASLKFTDPDQLDPKQERLLNILSSLGQIGDEASVKAVLDFLDETQDPVLRGKIVLLLGEMDHELALDRLLKLVQSGSNDVVRLSAAYALLSYEDRPEVTETLSKILGDSNQGTKLRKIAMEAVIHSEKADPLPMLEKMALEEVDRELAIHAVYMVHEVERGNTLEHMKKIYKTTDRDYIKKAVLDSSGDFEDGGALSFFQEVLATEKDEDLRTSAIHGLGRWENPTALKLLRQILDDKNAPKSERITAMYAITEFEEKSVEIIKQIITSGDKDLFQEAVYALGDAEDASVVPFLVDLLQKEKDPETVRVIMDALGNLGSDEAREALIEMLKKAK